jgi:hypothetical protein
MPLRLETPEGLPTESAMAEDVAWSSLVSTQLEDVRKTAENWRNGLLAIVATIAGFSVIKGPADITSLDRPFGYAVGWLLLVALTSGLFGAWSALGAAYGRPGVPADQTGWPTPVPVLAPGAFCRGNAYQRGFSPAGRDRRLQIRFGRACGGEIAVCSDDVVVHFGASRSVGRLDLVRAAVEFGYPEGGPKICAKRLWQPAILRERRN